MIILRHEVYESTSGSPSCWTTYLVGTYPTRELAVEAADRSFASLKEDVEEYNSQIGPESNSYYRQFHVEIHETKSCMLACRKKRQRKVALVVPPYKFKRKPRN
jgi:hypothetical protein